MRGGLFGIFKKTDGVYFVDPYVLDLSEMIHLLTCCLMRSLLFISYTLLPLVLAQNVTQQLKADDMLCRTGLQDDCEQCNEEGCTWMLVNDEITVCSRRRLDYYTAQDFITSHRSVQNCSAPLNFEENKHEDQGSSGFPTYALVLIATAVVIATLVGLFSSIRRNLQEDKLSDSPVRQNEPYTLTPISSPPSEYIV